MAAKKKSARKYSKAASEKVGDGMHEQKRGKLRSGRSGKKVTSRASDKPIAIGLSEARAAGKKVAKKKAAARESAKRKPTRKTGKKK